MGILDLIRNYGNRQVVREKDKAIIELAVNGVGGGNIIDTKVISSLTSFENTLQEEIAVAQFRFYNSENLKNFINDLKTDINVVSIGLEEIENYNDDLFTLTFFQGSNNFKNFISSDLVIIDNNFSSKTIEEIINISNIIDSEFYLSYKLDLETQKIHVKIYGAIETPR